MNNTGTIVTYDSAQSYSESNSKRLTEGCINYCLFPFVILLYMGIFSFCFFLSSFGLLGFLLKYCYGCKCKDCDNSFKNCVESPWETFFCPYHNCVKSRYCK